MYTIPYSIPSRAETRQVMQACVWAEWRTVGVVVGVLNDEEHEQDKDDPSSTHHDDRGGRGQIGGPCSCMCPRRVLGFVGLLSPHLRLISETSFKPKPMRNSLSTFV